MSRIRTIAQAFNEEEEEMGSRSSPGSAIARHAPFALAVVVALGTVFMGAQLFGPESAQGGAGSPSDPVADSGRRVGVVLVSHGSHSEKWRDLLFATESAVEERILKIEDIHVVHTAFMEYTEPSIATRLEECDTAGCTDILVVPLLLTVSGHSFDDIPTICGLKADASSLAHLEAEGTRVYSPRASVHLSPTLDFSAMLEHNVIRRLRKLSTAPEDEGVVLVAYGDAEYDSEWTALMQRLQNHISSEMGIDCGARAWCGHIAHYEKQPTIEAIRAVLRQRRRALVLPILVSVSENFQHKIIGGAVIDVGEPDRVVYVPDAILPEPVLDDWIVETVAESRAKLDKGEGAE